MLLLASPVHLRGWYSMDNKYLLALSWLLHLQEQLPSHSEDKINELKLGWNQLVIATAFGSSPVSLENSVVFHPVAHRPHQRKRPWNSQGKAIKERVYWHCLCELLALAKQWPPADGKTSRCPQINRCWKCFVNHWQSSPRSEYAVSGFLSDEPEHFFFFFFVFYKIASTIRESPLTALSHNREPVTSLLYAWRVFPNLELVLPLWFFSVWACLFG